MAVDSSRISRFVVMYRFQEKKKDKCFYHHERLVLDFARIGEGLPGGTLLGSSGVVTV
jgi:hypothetical protein